MGKDNSVNTRTRMIDRIIAYYKAQKLRLKASAIQAEMSEEDTTATRMIKGYNKNRHKIENKPKQDIPQTEKRRRKIADLASRKSSWRGLI
jgi:hypothetical protein